MPSLLQEGPSFTELNCTSVIGRSRISSFWHNVSLDYCFDTSGINRLHDDPARAELIAGLLSSNRVLVSELSIVEAIATQAIERRGSLLRLQGQLTRGNMPLLTPTKLLRRLTLAHVNGLESESITSDKDSPEAWLALQAPEKFLDEDSRQSAYSEKLKIEAQFTAAHKRGRMELRELFPGTLPKNLGQMLQFLCNNPLSFLPIVAVLYEEITKQLLTEDGMRSLFTVLPEWPLYLAGWAQGMYARAFQDQNYGWRKNPGTIDLWFAVYLEHCDCFVTDDEGQFKALRVIRALACRRSPKARVMRYRQFRSRLFLSPDPAVSKNDPQP